MKQLTDTLLQDVIGPSGKPNYSLDPGIYKLMWIKSRELDLEIMDYHRHNFTIPLWQIDSAWVDSINPSLQVQQAISHLYSQAAIKLRQGFNHCQVANFLEMLKIASRWYHRLNIKIGNIIVSQDIALELEPIINNVLEQNSVGLIVEPSLESNVILCCPDPEYTGVIPISSDYCQIGAMLMLNHMVSFQLTNPRCKSAQLYSQARMISRQASRIPCVQQYF